MRQDLEFREESGAYEESDMGSTMGSGFELGRRLSEVSQSSRSRLLGGKEVAGEDLRVGLKRRGDGGLGIDFKKHI